MFVPDAPGKKPWPPKLPTNPAPLLPGNPWKPPPSGEFTPNDPLPEKDGPALPRDEPGLPRDWLTLPPSTGLPPKGALPALPNDVAPLDGRPLPSDAPPPKGKLLPAPGTSVFEEA